MHAFQQMLVGKGMASQRGTGATIDGADYTTFNARTYLQPQLNKAVAFADKDTSPLVDRNPKDFVLWYRERFALVRTGKDNTGERKYTEGIVFPTLQFPSDHGITWAELRLL